MCFAAWLVVSPVCCVDRVRIPESRRDRLVQCVVADTSRDVVAASCGASRELGLALMTLGKAVDSVRVPRHLEEWAMVEFPAWLRRPSFWSKPLVSFLRHSRVWAHQRGSLCLCGVEETTAKLGLPGTEVRVEATNVFVLHEALAAVSCRKLLSVLRRSSARKADLLANFGLRTNKPSNGRFLMQSAANSGSTNSFVKVAQCGQLHCEPCGCS